MELLGRIFETGEVGLFIFKGKIRMINPNIKEYITNENNSVRYVLGKYTNRPLIVFGINPSIASAEKNDNTISIIEHVAEMRQCDGYLMFNIYPLRATKIDNNFHNVCDSSICDFNLQCIRERIYEGAEIVAAWGTHICDRDYFISMLEQINDIIKEKKAKWICLSKTKYGHPHHPTRLAYDKMTFEMFDMDEYIQNMKR